VQVANKAMNKNNTDQKSFNMAENGAKYEELKYQRETSTEEVVIPDEVPQVSKEQEIVHQLYYSQMNGLYNGQ